MRMCMCLPAAAGSGLEVAVVKGIPKCIVHQPDSSYLNPTAQGNHVCVENSMRQNCPVCFEYLFDSVRPTAVLPCGHTIHSDCLKEMENNRQVEACLARE